MSSEQGPMQEVEITDVITEKFTNIALAPSTSARTVRAKRLSMAAQARDQRDDRKDDVQRRIDRWRRHVANSSGRLHECHIGDCNYTTSDPAFLNRHMSSAHGISAQALRASKRRAKKTEGTKTST
ncbi:hypothetical protein K474DRAFT_1705818 [Panus rudis PR-1116 ss-1]|nr:hypothetical protein K474DRAFT_1705818 [Panus rudis PR-1116 ss-1]